MTGVVIELLKVKIEPQHQKKYLEKDREIWTLMLAKCPGFLSKEIWLNPQEPTELILVIRWASREQWKAIPVELLNAIAQQFDQELGDTYQIIESSEYQIYST